MADSGASFLVDFILRGEGTRAEVLGVGASVSGAAWKKTHKFVTELKFASNNFVKNPLIITLGKVCDKQIGIKHQ